MDNMNLPANHGYYQNKYETVAMNILAAMCSNPTRTQNCRQNAIDAFKQADAFFAELETRNG